MPDLTERFRTLRTRPAPDLWPEIERRQPRTLSPRRGRAAAAVALLVAAGGLVLVSRAFLGQGPRDTSRRTAPGTEAVVVQTVPFPAGPGFTWGMVSGHGSVWVQTGQPRSEGSGACGGYLRRFDAATGEQVASIPVEAITRWETGGGGTAVSDDAVWVLGTACPEGSGDGVLLQRIDPGTNAVVDVVELGPGHAVDVAAGDLDSSLWLLLTRPGEQGAVAELAEFDPATSRVVGRIPLDLTGSPNRVFMGAEAVWVATYLDDHPGSGLLKIDPESGDVVATLNARVDGPGIGTFGLWAAKGCTLVRIDPVAVRVVEERPEAGCVVNPAQLDVGEGGVWYLRGDEEAPRRPRLVRYNPLSGGVDVSIDLGKGISPIDVTLTNGGVWVLSYEGSLTKIELR
jgi:glutamine cyclotransferase